MFPEDALRAGAPARRSRPDPPPAARGVRPPGHAPAYLESRIARGDMPDGVLRRDLLAPNDVRCAANHIDLNVGSIM